MVFVTLFENYAARTKREGNATLAQLAGHIDKTAAATKAHLPWLKLARFGNTRSAQGSLRHDKNVLAVSGVEGDYDGEAMPFDDAVERVEKAGLECLLYTSPSHTPERPRWRVLCPLLTEAASAERARYVGRLNGLFGGIFGRESWTLSQAYYFGRVEGAPDFRVAVVEGQCIDRLDELDEVWQGPPGAMPGSIGEVGRDAREDAELIRRVIMGDGYHCELTALAARYICRGVKPEPAADILRGIMLSHPEESRDQRWHERYGQISGIVGSAVNKWSAAFEARRAVARVTHNLARQSRPAGEIKAAVLAEAERSGLNGDQALAIADRILTEKAAGERNA